MDIIAVIMSIITMLMSMLQMVLPPQFDDIFPGDDDIVIEEQIKEDDMTPSQLQENYDFIYYENIKVAIEDINNEAIGANAIDKATNSDQTLAGVYINDEGETNVVVLKNNYIDGRIYIYKDITVNLGGNEVVFNSTPTGFEIRNNTEDLFDIVTVNFNGRIDGSKVINYWENAAAIVNYVDTVVNVDEGTYITRSFATALDENYCGINGKRYQTRTFYCSTDGVLNISNVDIFSNTDNGVSYGIVNFGELNIENSNIVADSKYNYDGETIIFFSEGIRNAGIATIKNCNVTGTHTGISSGGELYVDGGTYESVGIGGIYIYGIAKTSYIYNATVRECDYKGIYNVNPERSSHTGLCIGGATEGNNLSVYVDSCEFYGTRTPIELQGSNGEQYNTIYISNSETPENAKIIIDSDTHSFYLGTGNSFAAGNTTKPHRVILSDELYKF